MNFETFSNIRNVTLIPLMDKPIKIKISSIQTGKKSAVKKALTTVFC